MTRYQKVYWGIMFPVWLAYSLPFITFLLYGGHNAIIEHQSGVAVLYSYFQLTGTAAINDYCYSTIALAIVFKLLSKIEVIHALGRPTV